jgi:hypothetical protein
MKKFVGLIAETLTGEGCTAVDATKRAMLVMADLRDMADPKRLRFQKRIRAKTTVGH